MPPICYRVPRRQNGILAKNRGANARAQKKKRAKRFAASFFGNVKYLLKAKTKTLRRRLKLRFFSFKKRIKRTLTKTESTNL
jgi:hypothetical protein